MKNRIVLALTLTLSLIPMGCASEPVDPSDVRGNTSTQGPEDTPHHADATTDITSGETAPGDTPGDDGGRTGGVDADAAGRPSTYVLIDNGSWVESLADSDPFRTDGTVQPDVCPPEDYTSELTPEGVLFEVNTTFCAWLTVTQPLLAHVPVGAEVSLVIRHAEIISGDAPFTLAVAMGSDANPVWSEMVEATAEANVFHDTFIARRRYEAGEPVYFHLQNHGVNTWNFVAMTAAY